MSLMSTLNLTNSDLVAAKIYEVTEEGNDAGGEPLTCMFNPYQYQVSQSNTFNEDPANNSGTPQSEFKQVGAQTLSLELLFDTYESSNSVSMTNPSSVMGGDVQSVTDFTDKLWNFMSPPKGEENNANDRTKKGPPIVAFEWGVFKFVSVIQQMTQTFTLFASDGTPVRAKVNITFKSYKDDSQFPSQNPTSGTNEQVSRVWRVTAGDRLDVIAAKVYGDATKWRRIAAFNQIGNPLTLRPGQELSIPTE